MGFGDKRPIYTLPLGVQIGVASQMDREVLFECLSHAGLSQHLMMKEYSSAITISLRDGAAATLVPGGNTLGLASSLGLRPGDDTDAMEREILIALLCAPRPMRFPSVQEFTSQISMRRAIARAAGKTRIAFDSEEASRPEEDWEYKESVGFTLLPGRSLVQALARATQPGPQGRLYAYSCYRASEYVLLLGIAQELERSNPELLKQLESRWRRQPIASRNFHETFLQEFGSMDEPLPPRYFVPGDRVWFCNPDESSSDIAGYEGSWVIYLGGGRFSDFWRAGHSYTLTEKCVEIFHWRDGACPSHDGHVVMDEVVVNQQVKSSLADEERIDEIMSQMCRLRSRQGLPRSDGGCLDASREFPKFVHPGTQSIFLPNLDGD